MEKLKEAKAEYEEINTITDSVMFFARLTQFIDTYGNDIINPIGLKDNKKELILIGCVSLLSLGSDLEEFIKDNNMKSEGKINSKSENYYEAIGAICVEVISDDELCEKLFMITISILN